MSGRVLLQIKLLSPFATHVVKAPAGATRVPPITLARSDPEEHLQVLMKMGSHEAEKLNTKNFLSQAQV